jgi:DHA2 family multidrug resistance protein
MDTRNDTIEYGLRRWIIVLGVVVAPLMETIDSSIVNVALPTIQGNLGATFDQAAWVVTAYLVANVIVIPLTPWLQLRFGRRQYFGATVAGFTLTSVLCGLSGSIEGLIALRALQGLFGGGLIATAQAALRDIFPLSEIGTSQGIFAIVVLIGPVLAPTLGGAIIDVGTWQWIFYINLVPGAISGLIVATMLRNPTEPRRSPVDIAGIGLLTVALGGLQYVLDEGERRDWFSDPGVSWAAAASAAAFIAFVLWELFGTKTPIVDLRVLRYRSVAFGTVLAGGVAATFFPTTLMVPQYTQQVLGFTALGSGELMFFRALPVMLFVPVVVAIVSSGRLDSRLIMGVGYALTALGSSLLARATTSDSTFASLVPGLVIGGIGSSMLFIPLLITVQSATPAAETPNAAAFVTLAFQLGGSLAAAASVTLLDRRAQFHTDVLAGTVRLASPGVRDALATLNPARIAGLVQTQAVTLAFADVGFAVMVLAAALIPLLAFMQRPAPVPVEVSFE